MLQINLASTRDPIVQTKINLSEEVWNENKQKTQRNWPDQLPTNERRERELTTEWATFWMKKF